MATVERVYDVEPDDEFGLASPFLHGGILHPVSEAFSKLTGEFDFSKVIALADVPANDLPLDKLWNNADYRKLSKSIHQFVDDFLQTLLPSAQEAIVGEHGSPPPCVIGRIYWIVQVLASNDSDKYKVLKEDSIYSRCRIVNELIKKAVSSCTSKKRPH